MKSESASTLETYLSRIRTVLPDANLGDLEFIQDGLVNDVVVVNRSTVFRFPKDDRANAQLAHEHRVLEIVSSYVTIPVPRFDIIDVDLGLYQYLPGEPLTRELLLGLPQPAMAEALRQLGTFLSELHAIPTDDARGEGVTESHANRASEDWVVFFNQVREHLFPLMMRHQRDWASSLFQPIIERTLDLTYAPSLIHGDLGSYHVLFDSNSKRISGVIDFGTAGIGDPAIDVACLMQFLGESLLHTLSDTFPELPGLLERARFLVQALELEWALIGVINDDHEMLLAHLGGARDVGSIARSARAG